MLVENKNRANEQQDLLHKLVRQVNQFESETEILQTIKEIKNVS
ncbi:MAG: hypothetical protein QM479_05880 [Pseudomonadota bacterium]